MVKPLGAAPRLSSGCCVCVAEGLGGTYVPQLQVTRHHVLFILIRTNLSEHASTPHLFAVPMAIRDHCPQIEHTFFSTVFFFSLHLLSFLRRTRVYYVVGIEPLMVHHLTRIIATRHYYRHYTIYVPSGPIFCLTALALHVEETLNGIRWGG